MCSIFYMLIFYCGTFYDRNSTHLHDAVCHSDGWSYDTCSISDSLLFCCGSCCDTDSIRPSVPLHDGLRDGDRGQRWQLPADSISRVQKVCK